MPDKMIVVMGPTGVGKSSFIRNALPEGVSADIQVGHHIHSETSQVQTICWATQYGIGLNLVDTPGFDDSRERVTDADILAMIATFLAIQCREGTSELIGLVYLHRISDTRVGGTSKRNLRMFQKLCGQDSLKNVVIVTTMWDKVMLEEGLQREQELISSDNLFKPLLNGGAVMVRHDRTQQSARNVIRHLFKMKGTTIQIVRELVIDNKSLVDTEAGMELQSEVRKVLQKHQKDLQILEDELRKAKQQHKVEAAAEKRKVEQDIAKLHGQLKKLGESTGTEYISSSLLTSTGGHLRSDSTDAPTRGSNFHPPLPKRHDGNYIRTDACARSEVKCILNCLEILSLVKRAQSKATSTDIGVMESIICRAIDFAMAVVCGLERVQRGCLEAQSILTSRNALDLHKFSGELQQALTKAHERLLRAQQGMNGAIRPIGQGMWTVWKPVELLSRISQYLIGGAVARLPDEIVQAVETAVANMDDLVKWWAQLIGMVSRLKEDASRVVGVSPTFDGKTMATLKHIIHDLDSHDGACRSRAYELCEVVVELHQSSTSIVD